MTKIALIDFSEVETFTIQHLLSPYQVELTEEDSADLLIRKGPGIRNSIHTKVEMPNRIVDRTSERLHTESVEIGADQIVECSKILERVMNPRIALRYLIATGLPFEYNVMPSSIRNRFLSNRKIDTDLSRHLSVETARKTLVSTLSQKGFRLLRRRPPSLLITHDIDTEQGLQRAAALKSVENELGMKSFWFLPSIEYPISATIAKELTEGSVIGSHDIRHDGKLIRVRKRTEVVQRLRESRLRLETIFEHDVVCFRSPLLQFSRKITSALKEAGYLHDFSVPCWEPIHPSTMEGFGIESTQPFEIDGITETPLTLFQDHQVLYMMGMDADHAIKLWVEQAKLIRSFGGDIVLLIHPDYAFSRDTDAYRRLLKSLSEVGSDYSPIVP